jgi:entericidin B
MPKIRSTFVAGIVIASVASLASCGNTVRGVGKDAAGMVHATKDATHDVAKAAK